MEREVTAGAEATRAEAGKTPPPTGWRATFHSLRVRNFRLFILGQLLSATGTWMQSVAAPFLVLQLTHSRASRRRRPDRRVRSGAGVPDQLHLLHGRGGGAPADAHIGSPSPSPRAEASPTDPRRGGLRVANRGAAPAHAGHGRSVPVRV